MCNLEGPKANGLKVLMIEKKNETASSTSKSDNLVVFLFENKNSC